MSSSLYSENRGHRDALLAAATTYQSVAVSGASQPTVKAASIAFYRAAWLSAVANGCSPSVFTEALRGLGSTPF